MVFGRRAKLAVAVLGVALYGCSRESPPRESIPDRVPVCAQIPNHLISSDELEMLQSQGLADPIQQIVSSLSAHPELISHPGVLGGRMGFYSDEEIHVLNARTVFARFTDGHIEGSGIFEFTVDDDGGISWRVLNSRIEGPPVEVTPNSALELPNGAALSVIGQVLGAGTARR